MGFDVAALKAAVARHGRVTRVVVAEVSGSSPREVGAAMLVWEGGQDGTIGGGALEHRAAAAARAGRTGLSRHALGPALGQCCGGAVVLLSEIWDAAALAALEERTAPEGGVIARPATGRPEGAEANGNGGGRGDGNIPLAVRRLLARARSRGELPAPQLVAGWMVEPVHRPARALWIWGAGHVGRAVTAVLAPLPDFAITWVDTGPERFPDAVPAGVTMVPAARPAELVRHAPATAEHLVLTWSHAMDLEICHRLLGHGFAFAGLIGSATKWARFRSRLAALGHRPERIAAIVCPVGRPALGKHPQAIAVGIAADLLDAARAPAAAREETGKDMRA